MEVGPLPSFEWKRLLDYRDNGLHPATRKSIERAQEAVKRWGEAWARGEYFRPQPKCPESKKAAAFAEIWADTFAPLHAWLREAALAFGRSVANAYGAFRLSEAVMTYDDQVRLALRVLEHPAVKRELAAERLSVLLDEAQDTDPRQFEVLLRVAGLRNDSDSADDQSFCIVGDFQQAIYAPRSDLTTYQAVHDEIITKPRGASSRLKVTFRCDRAIIDFVNRVFPSVLNQVEGQCAFETLVARDEAGPGEVTRWICPDEPERAAGKKISAEARARHEAQFLARRIQELGPTGFGASGWSQVAILCPRKNWLLDLQRELVALGLPVQLHSSSEQRGERAPGAWLTALIWVAAHPEDSFEIAGVLREIFGISDHDMALHTQRDGDKLRLDRPMIEGDGPLMVALRILREACASAENIPLHQAVQNILEKTHLRARLNSIAEMELENIDRELDDFLAVINARSAEGVTLAELAQELRLGLAQVHPAEEEIRDAIQLLTSHKAKGLEWEAVIVPYVFRTIESKAIPYPRFIQLEGGRETVCRDKADFAVHAQAHVNRRERQQLQRLLYVMGTRAKRTLLFLDDETLFSGQIRRSGWSAGELLELISGGVNRDAWKALSETLSLVGTIRSAEPVRERFSFPDLSQKDLRRAIERAGSFPRRVTPHALANHASEAEPEKQSDREDDTVATNHPGILYGTWWHELVETIPWQQPIAAWQQKFVESLLRSPQPERAAREWELFCRSKLASWLAQPGRLIQIELPFLWRKTDQPCVEGVMDLAVYTNSESSWQVIDWKTNQLGPAGGAELVEIYRGQINAYVQVLREMLSVEVKGSLYITQTGEWVPVE